VSADVDHHIRRQCSFGIHLLRTSSNGRTGSSLFLCTYVYYPEVSLAEATPTALLLKEIIMPPIINMRKCPAQNKLCKAIPVCPTEAILYVTDKNEPLGAKIVID
jgi:hypothetical protein